MSFFDAMHLAITVDQHGHFVREDYKEFVTVVTGPVIIADNDYVIINIKYMKDLINMLEHAYICSLPES